MQSENIFRYLIKLQRSKRRKKHRAPLVSPVHTTTSQKPDDVHTCSILPFCLSEITGFSIITDSRSSSTLTFRTRSPRTRLSFSANIMNISHSVHGNSDMCFPIKLKRLSKCCTYWDISISISSFSLNITNHSFRRVYYHHVFGINLLFIPAASS